MLRLPAVATAPGVARHAVLALSPGLLRPRVAEDVALLVTELVTNAVRHGPVVHGASIEISLRASSRALLVEVADDGPGFGGWRPRPVPVGEGQDLRTDGYGLLLVEELAGRWGIVDHHNGEGEHGARVWFEIEHAVPPLAGAV